MNDSRHDEPEIEVDNFDAAGTYIGSGEDNADPALAEETVAQPEPELDGPALAVGNEPYRSSAPRRSDAEIDPSHPASDHDAASA